MKTFSMHDSGCACLVPVRVGRLWWARMVNLKCNCETGIWRRMKARARAMLKRQGVMIVEIMPDGSRVPRG